MEPVQAALKQIKQYDACVLVAFTIINLL